VSAALHLEELMTSLAETINNALRAVGPATEDRLRDVIGEFDALNLSAEERLAAVATAIAATAWTHHRRHKAVYLEAVRTWSLEIAAELEPGPLRLRAPADAERVADGAEVLVCGLDSLIELMAATPVRMQDRLVTELALISRLLGQNDANTIHLTLLAVGGALASDAYEAGAPIDIPLRQCSMPVPRDAALATLEPRGCA
jgi:hypothetical protein